MGTLSPGQSNASLRVTTDAFPQARRLDMWREIYGRNILKFDIDPIGDAPFCADVTFLRLPGVVVASGARSGAHYRATRELAARSEDNVVFGMSLQSVGVISQFGREATIDPGSAVVISAVDPCECTLRSPRGFQTLCLPRQTVAPLVMNLGQMFIREIPRTHGALQLLGSYLSILQDASVLTASGLAQRVATHIVDLVALTIGATEDAGEIARGRGLRAARLNAIKTDIAESIADEGLSVAVLAKRHRVSPRYVHMLFEAERVTFSQYVIEQRLARAHRMMADERFANRTISAIALDVGFSNLSHFNRVFRRRYGATPSDVREAARQARKT